MRSPAKRGPVELTLADEVRPAPVEALVQQLRPEAPSRGIPEQSGPRLVAPVDDRYLEVVPGGPIKVDGNGRVAEDRGYDLCGGREQAWEIACFFKAVDLAQPAQAGEKMRRRIHVVG